MYDKDPTAIQVPPDLHRHYSNKWWRLNNLYYIIDEQGKKVLFRCNAAQERFYDELWYQNIVLKSRQQGFTTFIDLNMLDDALWSPNLECGIIAHNRADATKIFRRKIQYPFRRLPQWIRDQRPLTTDSAQELSFSNGSVIYVATSLRSGTVQRLHVSEHGKICRQYPHKAEELKTGTLNAVHPGSFVYIESTAEGRFGDFFDWCQTAIRYDLQETPLTKMDRKFHFFPWWIDPKCVLPDEDVPNVVITKEDTEYFDKLETDINRREDLFKRLPEGVWEKGSFRLTENQKAFYVKKYETQQDKMLQEYPSTPEEAFDAAIKGAYFAKQMTKMRKDKRITNVPYDPALPVDVAWDFGQDDSTFLVFRQREGFANRIIDCYHNHDEWIGHYTQHIQETGYIIGHLYLPHDGSKRTYRHESQETRQQTIERLLPGVSTILVPRAKDVLHDKIQPTRVFLGTCWIDETNCAPLIQCLDGYRQKWDETLSQWAGKPVHDFCSHGASAIGELAMSEDPDHEVEIPGRNKASWRKFRRAGGRVR